jgi:hypothetical protein
MARPVHLVGRILNRYLPQGGLLLSILLFGSYVMG